MKFSLIVCLFLFSLSAFAEGKIAVNVSLSPAGSFQAVSKKIKGDLLRTGDVFKADKLSVSIESLKTGIDLRDEHFWKHLNSNKHSKATLWNVLGQNGRGKAELEVNGVKKPVAITYKVSGQEIEAKFSVNASDFKLPKAEYLGVGVDDKVNVEATIPYKVK